MSNYNNGKTETSIDVDKITFDNFLYNFKEQNREKIIAAINYDKARSQQKQSISTSTEFQEEIEVEVEIETTNETIEEEIEI